MSPRFALPSIAVAALLLSACPYDGDFPIDAPDADLFEPALLGTWVPADDSTSSALEIEGFWFARRGDAEYHMGAIGCPEGGRAWLSRVGGSLFINLSSDGTTDFTIARIDLQADLMVVHLLEEAGLDSVTSSAQLRGIVERKMQENATDLFFPAMRLKRTSPVVSAAASGNPAGTAECEDG